MIVENDARKFQRKIHTVLHNNNKQTLNFVEPNMHLRLIRVYSGLSC